MKNKGFQFKQFYVQHDQCAMKVGTDGVLLGAWAATKNAKRILDLGTGSGLIALMLAQRTATQKSEIYAIERDPQAARQARDNFILSPWQSRLYLVEQEALQFCAETTLRFDMIVANPPYFAQGIDCRTDQRNQARYAQQSHLDWLHWAENCLSEQGEISFVLPFEAAKNLQKQTALYCSRWCEVITKQGKTPQRVLLSFVKQLGAQEKSELIIYAENNQYHQDFINLTRDFYLAF